MNYNMNPKLYEAISTIFKYHKFYYELLIFTTFTECKSLPNGFPMGVRVNKKRKIEILYVPDLIKKMSLSKLIFILIHECKHVLFNHRARVGIRDTMKSNIVQDMIINTDSEEGLSNTVLHIDKFIEFPNDCFYIPKSYTGKPIFENLYEWMQEQADKLPNRSQQQQQQQQGNGSGQGQSQGQQQQDQNQNQQQQQDQGNNKQQNKQQNKDQTGKNRRATDREMIEAFKGAETKRVKLVDHHLEDEISEELKEQIVKDFIEKCRNRGIMTSDVENTLNKLQKVKDNPLKRLKRYIMSNIGNTKYSTWQRPNRKNLPFKGFKKLRNTINVILDTSGSMCGKFEKVLDYLYRNDIVVNMLQCDTEVKETKRVKNKKQLNRIIIKGLGGTTLQPALDLVAIKYQGYLTVVLTDGYTDELNVDQIKKPVVILTIGELCPIAGKKKPKQIKINKDE